MSLLIITSSVTIIFGNMSLRIFSVPLMCYWLIPNKILLIKMLCRIKMPLRSRCFETAELLLWMCNFAKKNLVKKLRPSFHETILALNLYYYSVKTTIWLFYTEVTPNRCPLVYPLLSFYRIEHMLLGFYSLALFWFDKTC